MTIIFLYKINGKAYRSRVKITPTHDKEWNMYLAKGKLYNAVERKFGKVLPEDIKVDGMDENNLFVDDGFDFLKDMFGMK
jgi:hypothetical protein